MVPWNPAESDPVDWSTIQTVFLDMDGTLLDLHFDNYFWRQLVPARYAQRHGLSEAQARALVYARYREVEGTLAWYSVDHWSQTLDLDIALLKEEVEHLIQLHPQVLPFLETLGTRGKRRVLLTNAHPKSIALKLRKTRLGDHLDRILCAHELGLPKERPGFWDLVQAVEPFSLEHTLFIDDSPAVLQAAQRYGFRHLLAVRKPDSQSPPQPSGPFPAIDQFDVLLDSLRAGS